MIVRTGGNPSGFVACAPRTERAVAAITAEEVTVFSQWRRETRETSERHGLKLQEKRGERYYSHKCSRPPSMSGSARCT